MKKNPLNDFHSKIQQKHIFKAIKKFTYSIFDLDKMKPSILKNILVCWIFSTANATAVTIIYPGIEIEETPAEKVPWLAESNGDDGYVGVSVELIGVPKNCVTLENKKVFRDEKIVVVTSVETNGFGVDGKEIPIAALGSVEGNNSCIEPVTFPIEAIPVRRLESRSIGNQGDLSIRINVRSTTETNYTLLSSAQILLGATAVVATGGAAGTIAVLSKGFNDEALTPMVKIFNDAASSSAHIPRTIKTDWHKIRTTEKKYEIPVYEAEKESSETLDEAIKNIESNPRRKSKRKKIFSVAVKFNFIRSLFDQGVEPPDYLPRKSKANSQAVLNYPEKGKLPNILQTLNNKSPSPITEIASKTDLKNDCNLIIARLENEFGLTQIDRALVLKAFIDEAKGNDNWIYDGETRDSCFKDNLKLVDTLYKIFPPNISDHELQIPDMQNEVAGVANFKPWKQAFAMKLYDIRNAMKSDSNRRAKLETAFGRSGIAFGSDDEEGWQATAESEDNAAEPQETVDDLGRLAKGKLVSGGCFFWANIPELEPTQLQAHFIGRSSDNALWKVQVSLEANGQSVKGIRADRISRGDAWARHAKEARKYPRESECHEKILGQL